MPGVVPPGGRFPTGGYFGKMYGVPDIHLLEILKQGAANWNHWRDQNLGIVSYDLSVADLRRAKLSGARLFGANLSEAKLGAADLREADLREATSAVRTSSRRTSARRNSAGRNSSGRNSARRPQRGEPQLAVGGAASSFGPLEREPHRGEPPRGEPQGGGFNSVDHIWPTWAGVLRKAEPMKRKNEDEISTAGSKHIEGLPVIRRNCAGGDLGSKQHWMCGVQHRPLNKHECLRHGPNYLLLRPSVAGALDGAVFKYLSYQARYRSYRSRT